MKKEIEVMTKNDFLRLSSLLSQNVDHGEGAAIVEEKLGRAQVIEAREVPDDLVTMNSRFLGVITDGAVQESQRIFTLVYPKKADIDEGCISVMAPLGAEILGARVGQKVDWCGADGAWRSLLISQVLYQPEASGDWDL